MAFYKRTTLRNTYKFLSDDDGHIHVVAMHPGGVPGNLLRHARADALETAKDITESAAMRGDQLTAEEASAVSALKAEIKRIDEVYNQPGRTVWEHPQADSMIDTINGPYPDPSPSRTHGPTYRSIFGAQALSMDGFNSAAEYFDLLRRGVADPRFRRGAIDPQAATSFSGSTGSGGGYTLPTAIAAPLLDSLLERSVILGRSTIVPMTTRKVAVWGFDSQDQSTAHTLMGGIAFEVIPEGSSVTVTAGRVRGITLSAQKLMAVTKVSLELLDDSPQFEAQLRDRFAEAAGFVLDDMLINGSGTNGEFLGILNSPSKIAIAAGSQTTSTYVWSNAIAQRARLIDGGNPIWIANQDVLPQLYGMTLANAGLVMAFDGKELLGIPVVVSSKAQSVGTEGDVILCDLSRFLVGLRQEIVIEASPHYAFDSGEIAFRLILRLDSADSMSSAITPRYSSNELGWCITLATRTT